MASIKKGVNEAWYHVCKGLFTLLGKLPDWLMYYPIAEITNFVIYRIVRYRLSVVRTNLIGCYPNKSKQELREIERGFYRNLSEVIIDGVRMFGISLNRYKNRVEIVNLDQAVEATNSGDIIIMLGHYGNWEHPGVFQLYTTSQLLGVYHPLASPMFDRLMRSARSRFGALPVSMKLLLKRMVELKRANRNSIIALVADQNTYDADACWTRFLGRPTAFVAGGEKLATRFNIPIYYIDIVKCGKSKYKIEFILIYDGQEQLEKGEITRRYVRELEKTINRAPEYWMWSHKRWKVKPPIGWDYEL